jgi:hypothetical protein
MDDGRSDSKRDKSFAHAHFIGQYDAGLVMQSLYDFPRRPRLPVSIGQLDARPAKIDT